MTRAFREAGSRAALLTAIDAAPDGEAHFLLARGSFPPAALDTVVARTGWSPVFALLVRALAEGEADFARAVLAAVPDDADTAPVAHRWLASLWAATGAETGDAALDAAAAACLRLYADALAGQAVAPGEWRAVRRAFAGIADADAAAAGAVLAAAAWDPVASPGAIGDVVLAWDLHRAGRDRAELGWTARHGQMRDAYFAAMVQSAEAHAGPRDDAVPGWDDSEDGRAWAVRLDAGMARFRADNRPGFPDLDEELRERKRARIDHARALLIDAIRG